MRSLVAGSGACLVLASAFLGSHQSCGQAPTVEKVRFDTVDRVTIRGTFYASSKGTKAPCALLLHDLRANRGIAGWDDGEGSNAYGTRDNRFLGNTLQLNVAAFANRYTNLQDHVMVHVGYARPTIVGDYCSITHRVVLHGCTIGDNCLIGIGATVMEGAVIGENSIVAGHSFVADNTIVPPNSIVMGTPAKVVRTVNSFVANHINALLYHRNALAYARGDHRAWDGPDYQAEMARWKSEAERQFAQRYGRQV